MHGLVIGTCIKGIVYGEVFVFLRVFFLFSLS